MAVLIYHDRSFRPVRTGLRWCLLSVGYCGRAGTAGGSKSRPSERHGSAHRPDPEVAGSEPARLHRRFARVEIVKVTVSSATVVGPSRTRGGAGDTFAARSFRNEIPLRRQDLGLQRTREPLINAHRRPLAPVADHPARVCARLTRRTVHAAAAYKRPVGATGAIAAPRMIGVMPVSNVPNLLHNRRRARLAERKRARKRCRDRGWR